MNKDYFDYKNISQLLDLYEFDIIVNDDLTLSVHDRQGGNLGGIESEKFNTFDDIIERMDAYHYDYIVRALEEIYDISESDFDNWHEMYNYLKLQKDHNCSWDVNMLGLICGGKA